MGEKSNKDKNCQYLWKHSYIQVEIRSWYFVDRLTSHKEYFPSKWYVKLSVKMSWIWNERFSLLNDKFELTPTAKELLMATRSALPWEDVLRLEEFCSGDPSVAVCDSPVLIAEKLSFDFKWSEYAVATDAFLKYKEMEWMIYHKNITITEISNQIAGLKTGAGNRISPT